MGIEIWWTCAGRATPKSVEPLRLFDVRNQYNGIYQRRSLEEITEYTIHHFGDDNYLNDSTWEETLRAVYNYQVGAKGWPGIAYAFIVRPDREEIAWVGNFDTIRYHAGGAKHLVYGVGTNNVVGLSIAIAGNWVGKDPDAKTLERVRRLISWIETQLPPRERRIVGHQEVSPTECPGDNWKSWKHSLLDKE